MWNYEKYLKWRFWRKVNRKSKDECWEWTAFRNNRGYGQIRVHNKMELVHRVSWNLHFGPIPDGKLVLHKCDNKLCVNPNHLYIGTSSDNMRDKILRNLDCSPGVPPALNPKEVQEVKRLYSTKKFTQRCLAKMFKCHYMTIHYIINNKGTYSKLHKEEEK